VTRTLAERLADVRRLVDAARDVSCDSAVRAALVLTTGLSREGVELALAEHLETVPDDTDLRRLVLGAGDAERVHVVLSSNVFIGGLRALAVARAAAERVTVTASRREPVFARALVERAADPALSLDDGGAIESVLRGEIHVYGRDETIALVRARAREGVRVLGHGSGLGVAVVTGRQGALDASRAIARDVAPFDQRGCLSPRAVLVVGGRGEAEALCADLDHALGAVEERVPRGALDADESVAATRYHETVAFAGRIWRGKAHLVGLAPERAPLTLAPPGRHLHVAAVESLEAARALLAPIAGFVVAVGSDAPGLVGDLVGHRVRVSPLGLMQRPALDGPVDLRGS
jgi:hypothetical protein